MPDNTADDAEPLASAGVDNGGASVAGFPDLAVAAGRKASMSTFAPASNSTATLPWKKGGSMSQPVLTNSQAPMLRQT
jgi:hypothetical protein